MVSQSLAIWDRQLAGADTPLDGALNGCFL